jgi:transposase InsO family protein
LFAHWGLPQRVRVDNGSPWGSWSDLPTDLSLWLIGLGVDMHWNHPNRPQENGVIERSQGTGKRWAEPHACATVSPLQRHFDAMDRIQREVYADQGKPTRLQAHPGLSQVHRPYRRAREKAIWNFQRVLEHLSGYAVTRRVGPHGHVSIYNRHYYLGIIHSRRTVQIMFDPEEPTWLVVDAEGHLLNRLAVKEITEPNIRALRVTKKSNRPRSQCQNHNPGP